MRLQRTGRKGQAHYRLVAQDAHRHPSSGKVAAYLGAYNPHAKTLTLNKEKIQFYLEHGAQPSDRVAKLLKSEGVKLPKWFTKAPKRKGVIRHPDKLRKNRPASAETPADKPASAEGETEKPAAKEDGAGPVAEEASEEPATEAQEPAAADTESGAAAAGGGEPAKESKAEVSEAEAAAKAAPKAG